MNYLINNENQKVQVHSTVYNECQSSFNSGVWMAIVKDVKNNPHVIILADNF